MSKLYWVESTLGVFTHQGVAYKGVPFIWFAIRDQPVDSYKKLIHDYDNLRPDDRMDAEKFVNELLTLDEVTALRAYLRRKFHSDIEVEVYNLPAEVEGHLPTKEVELDDDLGFYKLAEESDYPLPFKVWGHYTIIDLEKASPSDIREYNAKCKSLPPIEKPMRTSITTRSSS